MDVFSLAGWRTSKVLQWSFFAIAMFLLLTAPLVLFDYYKSIRDLGHVSWLLIMFGLGMRGLWIYIFFSRWLVIRSARAEMRSTQDLQGNRVS